MVVGPKFKKWRGRQLVLLKLKKRAIAHAVGKAHNVHTVQIRTLVFIKVLTDQHCQHVCKHVDRARQSTTRYS